MAELVIATENAEWPLPKEPGDATVLRLRNSADGDDESVYRYDRAGLLMALKSVTAAGGAK